MSLHFQKAGLALGYVLYALVCVFVTGLYLQTPCEIPLRSQDDAGISGAGSSVP